MQVSAQSQDASPPIIVVTIQITIITTYKYMKVKLHRLVCDLIGDCLNGAFGHTNNMRNLTIASRMLRHLVRDICKLYVFQHITFAYTLHILDT